LNAPGKQSFGLLQLRMTFRARPRPARLMKPFSIRIGSTTSEPCNCVYLCIFLR
jgi:hypothetical protein